MAASKKNAIALLMEKRQFDPSQPLPENKKLRKLFLEYFISKKHPFVEMKKKAADTKNYLVWDQYSVIHWKPKNNENDKEDEESTASSATNYARCNHCKSLFCFDGGISALKRHLINQHRFKAIDLTTPSTLLRRSQSATQPEEINLDDDTSEVSEIQSSASSATTSTDTSVQFSLQYYTAKSLSTADKRKFCEAVATCASLDIRPFTLLQGEGMKILLETIQDIIIRNGRVNISELQVVSSTVQRNIARKRVRYEEEIRKIIEENSPISIQADHWTDRFGKCVYFGACFSFCNFADSTIEVSSLDFENFYQYLQISYLFFLGRNFWNYRSEQQQNNNNPESYG